jgi:hypothetical protein
MSPFPSRRVVWPTAKEEEGTEQSDEEEEEQEEEEAAKEVEQQEEEEQEEEEAFTYQLQQQQLVCLLAQWPPGQDLPCLDLDCGKLLGDGDFLAATKQSPAALATLAAASAAKLHHWSAGKVWFPAAILLLFPLQQPCLHACFLSGGAACVQNVSQLADVLALMPSLHEIHVTGIPASGE